MSSDGTFRCSARYGLSLLILAGLTIAGCGDPAPTTKGPSADRTGGASGRGGSGGARSGGASGAGGAVSSAGGAGGVAVAGAGGSEPGGAGGSAPAAGGAGGEATGSGGAMADAAPVEAAPPVDSTPAPSCGNGMLEAGEQCDLGAMNEAAPYGKDKCSTGCKLAPYCGDDTKNGSDEECDNGQQNSDTATGRDGCTRACKIAPYCGDRDKDPNEECDAGPSGRQPANGMTGCTPGCKIIRLPACGDGVVNSGEECDNGAANNDTAAGANACTTECNRPRCGDSLTQAGEECDRGLLGAAPRNGVSGCTPLCKLIRCGNNAVDAVGEECDKGSDNIRNDSTYGKQGDCNRQCKTIKTFCGDGVPTPPEACDAGPMGKPASPGVAGCLPNCTLIAPLPQPVCNNGKKEGNEECDTAMNSPHGAWAPAKDGCNTMCKKTTQFCGDGVVNGPAGAEACDPGPEVLEPTDMKEGCSKTCTILPKKPKCGNGVQEMGEQCDHGVNNAGAGYGPANGCSTTCKLNEFCGDGVINGPEKCDDKDKNVTDTYFPAPVVGNPKPCNKMTCTEVPFCGDAKVLASQGETCDLGADNGKVGATCSAMCKVKTP